MTTITITDGAFLCGGIPFPDWFNTQIVGRTGFHVPIDGDAFKVVFDHAADLWAPEITLAQFVALFAIMFNETGGRFRPIAEMGGPRYCFETHMPGGGTKRSYNQAPNRLAGDQLIERGIIDETQHAAWNGKVWPGGSPDVLAAAEQCDFYKFRGRGFFQTTWRNNYERQVDPLLAAAGLPSCDEMTTAELDDAFLNHPSVALGAVKAFVTENMAAAFAGVEHELWAPVGTHVSGSTAYGTGVYAPRCALLFAEMQKAGVASGP